MTILFLSQGAVSGLVVSTCVIFWIVINAYIYHAPLPELPFQTSGCKNHLTSFVLTEIDLVHPKSAIDDGIRTTPKIAEPVDW